MLTEIDEWMYSIVKKDWDKFARTVDTGGVLDVPGAIAQRLSGLSIRKSHVVDALNRAGLEDRKLTSWSDDDLKRFIVELRRSAKPIVIVANKADIPGSEENIERLKQEFPDMRVVPTSALAELLLRKASRSGAIRYIPGDGGFEVIDRSKLDSKWLNALDRVRKLVLDKWGSTGVQDAVNTAVLDVLGMITVYPVDDPNRYSDKNGRILPDVLLVPRGTTARELAYKIHTDLGKTFLYAVNAKTKQRLGEGYELQDDDVIKIVAARS